MDPDRLASLEASQSGSTVYKRVDIWFHTVFERVNCLSTEGYKLIHYTDQTLLSTLPIVSLS